MIANQIQTVTVNALELVAGDKVFYYGAVLEVAFILKHNAENVAHCVSRLIGENMGNIPKAFFETPESYKCRGCEFADNLPDGLYFGLQGNENARYLKVVH